MKPAKPDRTLEELAGPFGRMAQLLGSNRTLGQVYAALLIQEQPVTLEGLQELLGFSKGGISTSTQKLITLGLVRKLWLKGQRKDHYVATEDALSGFARLMGSDLWPGLDQSWQSLSQSLRDIQKKQLSKETRDRVQAVHRALQRITETLTELPRQLVH